MLILAGCSNSFLANTTPEEADSNKTSTQSQLLPAKLFKTIDNLFIDVNYQKHDFSDLRIKKALQVRFNNQAATLVLTETSKLLLCKSLGNACTTLKTKGHIVADIAWAGNQYLGLAIGHHFVVIYDLFHNKVIGISKHVSDNITAISFDKLGASILIGTLPGKIYHWHFKTSPLYAELTRYGGHAAAIKKIVVHPTNRVFFSVDMFGRFSAWLKYESKPFAYQVKDDLFNPRFWTDLSDRVNQQLPAPVSDLSLRNDGKYILLALDNGLIQLWSVRGFKSVCAFNFQSAPFFQLVSSFDWQDVFAINQYGNSYQIDLSDERFEIPKSGRKQECSYESSEFVLEKDIQYLIAIENGFVLITTEGIETFNL